MTNRDDWRVWLKKNHETEKEVWLIYYRKRTEKPSIPYDDSVEEALCYGWVDSIIKKIDDQKFARKFTPRKDESKWSESNRRRAEKMIMKGKMTDAGLMRIKAAKNRRKWLKTRAVKKEFAVPLYFREALAKNKRALDNFNDLANSYRRNFVRWVGSAKKEETRKRRLVEATGLLEHNQKLGMK